MHRADLKELDGDLEIKIAQSLVERCDAWSLVYRKYRQSSFIPRHSAKLHLTLLDLLPTTVTWNAYYRQRLVGTMSVVVNSAAGLPSGLSYEQDLQRYGIDGNHLCETTKFAIEDIGAPSQAIATQIGASVIHWCALMNIDDVISVVHPRHARMWTRLFGWEIVGDVKDHPGVNNRPGILIRGDVRQAREQTSSLPVRGGRMIKQWQRQMVESPYPYRLSGSEATMAILQRPELILRGAALQRTGFARHYPWASARLCRLLFGETRGRTSDPLEYPKRERGFIYPNQICLRTSGATSPTNNVYDRLLSLNEPLALVISKPGEESRDLAELCDHFRHTAVTERNIEKANELLQHHLFDYILLAADLSPREIEILGTNVRKIDRALGIHTPILDLQAISDGMFPGLPYYPLAEQHRMRLSGLKRILPLLDEITEEWQGGTGSLVVNG